MVFVFFGGGGYFLNVTFSNSKCIQLYNERYEFLPRKCQCYLWKLISRMVKQSLQHQWCLIY